MQTHLEAQRKSVAISHLSRLLVLAITLLCSLVFVVDDLLPQVRVKGYTRKNGTYVPPHVRTRPDGNPYNNYSFPGNYNPNKGTITSGNPETYLKNYYNRSSNDNSRPVMNVRETVRNDGTYISPYERTKPEGNSYNNSNSTVQVRGYTRQNGTYVSPYERTKPDGNRYNNYSFPGNYNPNTGTITPGNPETYLKNYYNRSSNNYSSPSNDNPNTVTNDLEIPRTQLRNYEDNSEQNGTSSEQVHQRSQNVLTTPSLPAIVNTYTKISKAESNRRYSEALETFERSEYSKAITLFSILTEGNSNDNLSDNSQYWIGESYYGAGDFQNSIAAFKKVFTFSDNDKYDDALLKLGLCYMRIGDQKQAKVYFDRILAEYPESEYVGKARYLWNKIK